MSPGSAAVVRPATSVDLPAMATIYNDAVLHSVATFDLEPRPSDHYAAYLASTAPGDHVLVATDPDDGTLLGYAFSGKYRPRAAYAGTREVSVYLAEGARGRGVGRLLYSELLARVDADGIHAVLAVIAGDNPASVALHRSFGFEHAGTLREVGRKFDAWVDTAFWQRLRPDA